MKERMLFLKAGWVIVALIIVMNVCPRESSAQGDAQPDLTNGGTLVPAEAWVKPFALGPTGAFGWMWTKAKGRGRLQTTEGTTQILIAEVAAGSPAARSLKKGDVLIGVVSPLPPSTNGKFVHDARRELAASIIEAEKAANGGKLVLKIWRGGKTLDAKLTLKVMGTYSETSLAKCEKTEKIIKNACDYIERNGIGGGMSGYFNALGLLATGDKRYLSMVREFAQKHSKPREVSAKGGTFGAGYQNLFLTEYYLATKDASVLPAIKALSTSIALGQSGVGTWGHKFSDLKENGKPHGILGGYGAMNQAALPATISLALAQKCGVKNKEITTALANAVEFFRWYVDKGGIPYGDHPPWMGHACNGKNSSAAVLFNILGDEQAATFFSQMVVASYGNREAGHTGNYWSILWGPLAAACTGEEASVAFMREMHWYQDLQRRWEGNFHYQGQLWGDHGKYTKWDATGARLLHYCLPRQKLYITGRGGVAGRKITGKELQETVAAGRKNLTEGRSTQELLKLLGSWSPIVRGRAGIALSKKEDVSSQLISMLDSKDRYTRYGACRGLSCAGRSSEKAADLLVKLASTSPDPTLRYSAITAFFVPESCVRRDKGSNAGLYGAGLRAAPGLLKLAAENSLCRQTQDTLCRTLFYKGSDGIFTIYAGGYRLEKADRKLLIPAIRTLLKAGNGGSRSLVAKAAFDKLSEAELKELWGDIYLATKYRAPSGVMFSDGVRIRGLELMAKHGIEEGIPVGLDMIKEDRWGRSGRIPGAIGSLSHYEGAIKSDLGELKKMGKAFGAQPGVEEAFQRIEVGKKKPLTSIAAQVSAAEKAHSLGGGLPRVAASAVVASRAGASSRKPRSVKPSVPKGHWTDRAPTPTPATAPIRPARTLSASKQAALDRTLLKTLVALTEKGLLKQAPMPMSFTGSRVVLVSASENKVLTFAAPTGQEVDISYSKLTLRDRAMVAVLVAASRPDSPDAQAMAAVYVEAIGNVQKADEYFARADEPSRKKLQSLFD